MGGCDEFVPTVPPKRYRKAQASGSAKSEFYSGVDCTGSLLGDITCFYTGTRTYDKNTLAVTLGGATTCNSVIVGVGVSCTKAADGCETYWIFEEKKAQRLTTGECCPYTPGNTQKEVSDSLQIQLSEEDTNQDAMDRAKAAISDWTPISCATIATMAERTAGEYSFTFTELQTRAHALELIPLNNYTVEILFVRRTKGSSGPFEHFASHFSSLSPGDGVTDMFTDWFDVPNEYGFETKVGGCTVTRIT